MFHYYIRYSKITDDGQIVGAGRKEVSLKHPISSIMDIHELEYSIQHSTPPYVTSANTYIDFYALLRKDD